MCVVERAGSPDAIPANPGASTPEQRKEFLPGFVAEIDIDPDAGRGTIVFYVLPWASLMSVPGARDALLRTMVAKDLDRFGLQEDTWRVAA